MVKKADFIIGIAPRWRIRRDDPLNFVVEYLAEGGIHPTKGTKGPDHWEKKGFFSGLPAAIRALPTLLPFDPEIQDLAGLMTQFRAIATSLEESFEPIAEHVQEITHGDA